MPDRSQHWPAHQVACLLKLWRTHSATQIAAKLGRTRSAVCGKIGRLRREGLQPTGNSKKQYDSSPPRSPPRPLPTKTEPPKAKPPPIDPPLDMRPCLLAELTDRRCHWPLGPVDKTATLFCGGRTVNNSPWCAHHLRIAVDRNRKERQP